MTARTSTIEITARAKAFSAEGVGTYRFSVDDEGLVRVWDDIAGHYTLVHSLSEGAQRRLRRLAAEVSR